MRVMRVMLVTRLQGCVKLFRVELRVTGVLLAPLVRGVKVVGAATQAYIKFASLILTLPRLTELAVTGVLLEEPQVIRGRQVTVVVGVGHVIPVLGARVETPVVGRVETAGQTLMLPVLGVAEQRVVLLVG